MINWKKLDVGEYESEDERFHILKTWDRIYGNHWQLNDREDAKPNNPEYGIHHEPSLKECKRIAEWIVNKDKENDIEIDMDMF